MIDLSNPTQDFTSDADNNGFDDRIIWSAAANANGVFMDAPRGLLYVPSGGGLDIWAVYDNCCDLGVANSDGGACTLVCAANVCGDGKPWLGVEGCDDGNDVDDDGCRDACALPSCGDGVTQAGEGCDAGTGNGDDRACTAACQVNTCGDGKVLLGVEGCDAASPTPVSYTHLTLPTSDLV